MVLLFVSGLVGAGGFNRFGSFVSAIDGVDFFSIFTTRDLGGGLSLRITP